MRLCRTFSFNRASLTGLVDRWTGTFGLESLESAIAILFLEIPKERPLTPADTTGKTRETTHYLQQTVAKGENKLGKKLAPGTFRRRSGAGGGGGFGRASAGLKAVGKSRRFSVNQSNFFFCSYPFFSLLACIPPCIWLKKDKASAVRRVACRCARYIHSLYFRKSIREDLLTGKQKKACVLRCLSLRR